MTNVVPDGEAAPGRTNFSRVELHAHAAGASASLRTGQLSVGPVEDVMLRAHRLVEEDLRGRGWLAKASLRTREGPELFMFQKGPGRILVAVRAAPHPRVPPSLSRTEREQAQKSSTALGADVWLAQVELDSSMEPFLALGYTRVVPGHDLDVPVDEVLGASPHCLICRTAFGARAAVSESF